MVPQITFALRHKNFTHLHIDPAGITLSCKRYKPSWPNLPTQLWRFAFKTKLSFFRSIAWLFRRMPLFLLTLTLSSGTFFLPIDHTFCYRRYQNETGLTFPQLPLYNFFTTFPFMVGSPLVQITWNTHYNALLSKNHHNRFSNSLFQNRTFQWWNRDHWKS